MISLFIDTSLEDVSIALVKEGKELSQIHEYIPGKHSIYVTKYISDILKNNNLSPDNVDEIIVVNGPGSFTGIRIGVTIAKMFAYIKKIRIVTITSLKARVLGHTGNYLLTTIDAKHNNYYVGVYDKEYNTIEEKFTSFKEVEELKEGEVGFITASIKSLSSVSVGDTITDANDPTDKALPGYKPMKPMVYCGIYPIESNKYPALKEAIEKLKLNDASLTFEPETSSTLGFGFRMGFLGLLHLEIISERIEREFGIEIIATTPSVNYEINLTDGSTIFIDNPSMMPDKVKIKNIKEPYIFTNILVPTDYIGPIMELCQDKRGIYKSIDYLDTTRVNIHYELPLSEIVYDFFDRLKSSTKGYASFDYEVIGYKESDLVKMDILLNGEVVDALSLIVHKDFAYDRGRRMVDNLKNIIPRQMFEVPVQAVIGSKVIARSDIKAMRKDVLAKCYGGDITRKRKLLDKQKEGKKKMKTIGKVEIPSEAFLSILTDYKKN